MGKPEITREDLEIIDGICATMGVAPYSLVVAALTHETANRLAGNPQCKDDCVFSKVSYQVAMDGTADTAHAMVRGHINASSH